MCQQQYDITSEDLNPTFLYSCQSVRLDTEQPHSHDFIEIGLILNGECCFYIDGERIPVKKGDLLLLNPGTVHQSQITSHENPTTEFYVAFTNLHFRDMNPNQIHLPQKPFLLHPSEKVFLQLSRLAESIMAESCSTQPGRYFMLKAYLTQMILLLYREQVETPKSSRRSGYFFESTGKKYVVEQIIEYLDSHYAEKISLDQIAQNMYLSPFYISRLFKSELGDTPINYLIQLRMEKAKILLLEEPDSGIQEVARCVGYEDAYHFSKVFKKHYGMSPTKYRTTQKKSETE